MSYDDDTRRIIRLHDRIRELEAEVGRLRADNARQLSDLETVSGLAETLEAEVERLRADVATLSYTATAKAAEIERLQAALQELADGHVTINAHVRAWAARILKREDVEIYQS